MHYRDLRRSTALICSLAALAPSLATAEISQPIDVPAQPLADAITELGMETGLDIAASADAVAGKQSVAVRGPMAPIEALAQLLSGTELRMRRAGENGVVVSQNANPDEFGREEAFALPTILITGELIERSLQDSQTSAAIISGTALETRGDTDVQEVFNRTANASSNGFNFAIRGITSSGPSNTGRGQTVTTTIDGARVSNFSDQNVSTYSTWDLNQIEILRGPQSTQTGRNALAGSVTIRSNDPVYAQEGKARIGLSNGETGQAAIALNTPLIEDTLALRFSAEQFKSDGFVDYPSATESDAGEIERQTLRLGLRWDPTPDFSAILKYSKVDETAPLEEVDRATFPDRIVDVDEAGGREKDLDALSIDLSYALTDQLTLEASSNLTFLDTVFAFDPDGTSFNGGRLQRDADNRAIEQEIRLRYQTERLDAVVGLFYTEIDENSVATGTAPASLLPLPFPVPDGAQIVIEALNTSETKNTAVFGEIEYDLSPDFSVILGARYDVEEIRSTFGGEGFIIGAGPDPIPIPQEVEPPTETDFDAFLFKLGFVYDIDAFQSLGFTYQQGYRAGGRRTNLGAAPFETYTFDPEFTDNFELAYRSEWDDGNLVVNANLFYTKWKDQQVTVAQSDNPNDFIITNSGESRLWGAELEVRSAQIDNLDLFASLGYVNTRFTEFESSLGDLSGNSFIYAPEWTAAIGASYFFGNGWSLGGDLTYTGSTFSNVENDADDKNDAYWLTNLRLSKTLENGMVITGYVNNALDEDYTLFKSATRVTPGAPREFGVFAQVDF
ncbi:MAG: TonB-dependent receptor [Pseudomonadota bacterium]